MKKNREKGMNLETKRFQKSRIFRIAAVLLIGALAAGVFSACGSSASSAYYEGKNSAESSTASYAATEAAYESEIGYMGNAAGDYDYAEEPAEETAAASGIVRDPSGEDQTTKMVYTASVTIQTLEYDKSLRLILNAVSACNGFIESQSESNDNYSWYYEEPGTDNRYASIRARIPAASFDTFVEGLGDVGKVTGKNIYAENITQSYYDTAATVSALEIERDRLLEMMDKAETIEDMIAVESRLSEVERELNWYRTDLSAMDKDVEYSTVNITLDEVEQYTEDPPKTFGERIAEAFRRSGSTFRDAMQNILIGLIIFAPFLAIILAVIFVTIHFAKKASKKSAMKAAEQAAQRAAAERAQAEQIQGTRRPQQNIPPQQNPQPQNQQPQNLPQDQGDNRT